MTSSQPYPLRNYALGQRLLTLCSRVKRTRSERATQIGVHRRSVQKWESGETYPKAEPLPALSTLLIRLRAFTPDQQCDEAVALWQRVSEKPLATQCRHHRQRRIVRPSARHAGGKELLVSGSGGGRLCWWDVPSGECVLVREAHQGTVQSLRRTLDGIKLASCGDDDESMMPWERL